MSDDSNFNSQPHISDDDLVAELDQVILDFEEIQTDLNYKNAQDLLGELLQRLDLTPRERVGLEAEIGSLATLVEKLEHTVIHIAAFGLVGRGKSSLLNALLGQNIFTTGAIHGVTQEVRSTPWQSNEWGMITEESQASSLLRAKSLSGLGTSRIELVDTPGIDEAQGSFSEETVQRVIQQADLLLFVVAGDITRIEYETMALLKQSGKPVLLVFNKSDQYSDVDRAAIHRTIRDHRVQTLLSPDEIVMTAASPRVTQAVQRPDGTLTTQLLQGEPQVMELKLRILDILHREGKALVALNTLLYADDINEQIIERKLEIRDHRANDVIWQSVMVKAISVALNPITVVDMLGGAVIDVAMILTLSRLYGIAMTQADALDLLQKIALGLGGIGASELITTLGLGSLKSLLGLSTVATGGAAIAPYLSIAMAQAGVAGVSSYGIGQVTKAYLATGASWGPNGPKALVCGILASLDETSILNRIKADLEAKLDAKHRDIP